jgi:hypothetical protein
MIHRAMNGPRHFGPQIVAGLAACFTTLPARVILV